MKDLEKKARSTPLPARPPLDHRQSRPGPAGEAAHQRRMLPRARQRRAGEGQPLLSRRGGALRPLIARKGMPGGPRSLGGCYEPAGQGPPLRFAAPAGRSIILYNAWDAGSARPWPTRARPRSRPAARRWRPRTFHDAEALPLDLAIANAERVVAAVELPVTIDFEGGYAVEPEPLAANMKRLAATGAIGCNFEDQVVGGEGLHPVEAQAERLRAARAAAGPISSSTPAPTSSSRRRPRPTTTRKSTRRSTAPSPMPKPARTASSCPASPI